MKKKTPKLVPGSCFKHPLLQKLSDLATKLAGISFLIVFPKDGGWDWAQPSRRMELPKFCSMIQSTKEGAKHCKMCHVLMTVAACSEGLTEQHCHAHASILVAPICEEDTEGLAAIGTCTYSQGNEAKIWRGVRDRAKKLGIDVHELKQAYDELPHLRQEKLEIAQAIMAIAGEAVKEIRTHCVVEDELKSLQGSPKNEEDIVAVVEKELKKPASTPRARKVCASGRKENKGTALIKIVSDMISRKPNLPFSVEEIATAARITPNHFSTLFRLCTGQKFTDFLTSKRVELAKELLNDLTLNIGEIALSVGYRDAGYFTRRFKQKTGMTPREWRASVSTE